MTIDIELIRKTLDILRNTDGDTALNVICNLDTDFVSDRILEETGSGANGWIPIEDELPENNKYILLSFANFSVPGVGRYEEDEEGGAFYIGDDTDTCLSQDVIVNAWQPLPSVYEEE